MENDLARRIAANPKYKRLVGTRSRYGWLLSIITLLVYYGYIGVIAFDKEMLASRIGDGVMTLGIPVGMGIIVISIALIALYVRRANVEFDRLTEEIIEESGQ